MQIYFMIFAHKETVIIIITTSESNSSQTELIWIVDQYGLSGTWVQNLSQKIHQENYSICIQTCAAFVFNSISGQHKKFIEITCLSQH